jgi:hypothetical protein
MKLFEQANPERRLAARERVRDYPSQSADEESVLIPSRNSTSNVCFFSSYLMDSIAEESSLIRCCIRLIDRCAFMR